VLKAAAGFVAGIALASGVWALLAAREAAARVAVTTRVATPAAGPAAPPLDDASARTTLAGVQSEIARVEAEIASMKSRPAVSAAKARLTLADLAKKLGPAFAEDTWIWEANDERTQALIGPFLEELREQAAAKGITLYEAAIGPDGVPALAMAMLATLEPPPDAETIKALEEARKELGKEFEAYLAKRGGLTRVEQYEQILGMGGALDDLANERLQNTANDTWWHASEFWDGARPSDFLSFYSVGNGGDFGKVTHDWTEGWSRDLGLDDAQKIGLRPIVEEYTRAMSELNLETDKLAAPNMPAWPNRSLLIARMIAAQKRIAAELGLNEKQTAALRNWATVPSHDLRTTR